jgi:predicted PurR-regulated permease PerM
MTKTKRIPLVFLMTGLGIVLAIWLLREALAPFFLAVVLAYLLGPSMRFLARRLSRWAAALLVIVGFILASAGVLWLMLPPIVAQAQRFLGSMPHWKTALEQRWGPWISGHPWIQNKLQTGLEGLDAMVFLEKLKGASQGLLGVLLQVMTLLLVPIIVYYLLVEGPSMLKGLDELVPPRYRHRIRIMVKAVHDRLGGYIRGELGLAIAMSLLQGIAFQIMGVPYAWLLGLIAGVSNVVPYSPYLTAMLPALVMTGLEGGSWSHILFTAIVFTGVQKIEALYLTPVWVGRASKLHPLEVLLGILCFGFAFGVLGLIFAVPMMIVVKVVLQTLLKDYQGHAWFRGSENSEPEAS